MPLHTIGKYIIEIPHGHLLPLYQYESKLYDRGHITILKALLQDQPLGTFIDVGANVGDTAALISTISPSTNIICVEGDTRFIPYLRKNSKLFDNKIEIIDKFLFIDGLDKTKFYFNNDPSTGSFLPVSSNVENTSMSDIETCTLDNVIRENISIFKTDTDGFDFYIVEEFLENHFSGNEVIFFECHPNYEITPMDVIIEFFKKIERLKQFSAIIFDNHGVPILWEDSFNSNTICDLLNYIRICQRTEKIRIHYYDIWLFPERKLELFKSLRIEYNNDPYV